LQSIVRLVGVCPPCRHHESIKRSRTKPIEVTRACYRARRAPAAALPSVRPTFPGARVPAESENVRHVVVYTHQHFFFPRTSFAGRVQEIEHLLLSAVIGDHAMQNKTNNAVRSRKTFPASDTFHTTCRGASIVERASFFPARESCFPGEDTTGKTEHRGKRGHAPIFQSPNMSGRQDRSTTQSKVARQELQALQNPSPPTATHQYPRNLTVPDC